MYMCIVPVSSAYIPFFLIRYPLPLHFVRLKYKYTHIYIYIPRFRALFMCVLLWTSNSSGGLLDFESYTNVDVKVNVRIKHTCNYIHIYLFLSL